MGTSNTAGRRTLPFIGLLVVIVIYLAIIGVAHFVSTRSLQQLDYGRFTDVDTIVRATVVPVGLSVLFGIAVVRWLGWWKPVLGGDPPVQRWTLLVPAMLCAAIAIGTDYGTLGDMGTSFTVWLLVASLLVGLGEELMYRGIVVTSLRINGRSERTVAVWSSVLFGASHTVNWFVDGGGHVVQVIVTIFMGWFLYLTRRATRGLLIPVLVHGLWDFGLFSGNVTTDVYPGTLAFFAAQAVLIPVVIVRRKRIEPVSA